MDEQRDRCRHPMAGGVAKGFGITFLILGGILLLAGIAAAGFGYYTLSQEEERGVLGNPDAAATGEQLMIGGALAAGVAVLFFIVGGILAAIGGARARNELFRVAAGTGVAAAPAPTTIAPVQKSRAGFLVALAVLCLLLVGGVTYALAGGGDGGAGTAIFPSSRDDGGASANAVVQTFDGRVQGVRAPVVGGFNTGNSAAIHEMSVTPGRHALTATLNWSASGAAGAESLVLILEAERDGAWTELARGEGGPGLVVEVPANDLPPKLRARVFAGGADAVDQTYALEMVATPA